MSNNNIKTDLHPRLHMSFFSMKKPALKTVLAIAIALAAIGLGVLALRASAGHKIWMFHALGGIGDVGAWLTIACGASILTSTTLHYLDQVCSLRLRLQVNELQVNELQVNELQVNELQVNELQVNELQVNEFLQSWLQENPQIIDKHFEWLASQPRLGKGSQAAPEEAKFCQFTVSVPNTQEDLVFVLQMQAQFRKVSVFLVTATPTGEGGEEIQDTRPLGTEYESFINKLIEKGYNCKMSPFEANPHSHDEEKIN